MEKQIHQNANDYRDLCNVAGDVLKGKNVDLPRGYSVLETKKGKYNFKAVAYKKENEIIICYLGTDAFNPKDHATNVKMLVSEKETEQMESANQFYRKLDLENPNYTFKVIGHSEGGSEALRVGLTNKLPTVTFNAYGLNPKFTKDYDKELANQLVKNYRDPNDPISKLRPLIGKNYIVENKRSVFSKINPFGMVSSHRISNFGDCSKAQELEEYKKEHKMFIGCVDDVEITDNDIGKMSNELYQMYDNEISNRLSKGQILKESQAYGKTITGDLVRVSSYIRDDGTQVEGYYRKRPRD